MASSSISTPYTLAGKVAIVTGSSRGLGATMALDLAKRGAKVVVTYTSSSSNTKVQNLISQISNLGNGSAATSVQADLRDISASSKVVHHCLDTFGPHIDILVNNAGTELNKLLKDITAEDLAAVHDVNVRAPMLLTQAVLPHLRGPGRIINISSVGARAAFPALGLYCSSKAALEGFTRCWAAELGGDGTTVNAVAPGPIQSEMLDNIPPEIVAAQKAGTPVGKRLGTPEEVANIVGWLAGQEAGWVSGQVISASGGWALY